ncbi:MAG: UDP-glucose dehydrogenase family protein, partial [Demequina sp.]|uniref:UDP-glucose dehydrogenase family protein n=1 Tax=Demequina sp. TaxID=2050685 RepID=UPI003A87E510
MAERLSVFGTGYLGATHAAGMAELGHQVIGVDIDAEKIARLSAGEVPFFEPGLPELLRKHVESGRLRFTTDAAEAADFADVHFIGVGTPQRKGEYAADLTYVDAVIETLAPMLERPATLLGKSTVPVGTAARLAARLRELAPVGDDAQLGWNPEFLREGFAVEDTLRPDRIVVGIDPERPGRVEEVARRVYADALSRETPFLTTDLATAELVKVSANAFLATKISFINAIAEVCEATGADVIDLADAIGHDARIGRKFLGAGLGFGGGCLPKDIRAFMARAGELGVDQALTFLREVDTVNMRRREHAVELAAELLGELTGTRIGVLGAAIQPLSDALRDSPALDVAGTVLLRGAHGTVHDPQANANAGRVWPTLTYSVDSLEACRD